MSPKELVVLFAITAALGANACKPVKVAQVPAPSIEPAIAATVTTAVVSEPTEPKVSALEEMQAFMVQAREDLLALQSQPTDVEQIEDEDFATSAAPVIVVEETPVATIDEPEVLAVDPGSSDEPEPVALDALSSLAKTLLTQASSSDAPLREHLTIAILMALHVPEKPFEPAGLNELTDDEQEMLRVVHEHFVALAAQLEDGAAEDALLQCFSELARGVRSESAFGIARMELCSWVRDFGDIDPIDPPHFAPTERGSLIWYVELDGVEALATSSEKSWQYAFDTRVELLVRDTGIPVIAPIEGIVKHDTSAQARDLFMRDLMAVPKSLPFDWYTLKVTVVNQATGAMAQSRRDLLWVPNLLAGKTLVDRKTASASDQSP